MTVPGHDGGQLPQDDPPPLTPGVRLTAAALIVVALAAAGLLSWRRTHAATTESAVRATESASGPVVRAVPAIRSAAAHHLVLLGEAHPFASVTLYAKVSGYLKSISVDKGDRVQADQVVAVVESPETDASWSAARAEYEQKRLTASRIKSLLDKKFVSPQEADIAVADEAVARERLSSLTQQREFENLKVPFAGTVTARFADPGALVQNAASSQTSALPVVTIERTDLLRVYTYLDQSDAAGVGAGLRGTLTMDERAGVRMSVAVARTSGELDPKTRKLLVEFDVENKGGAIVPGSFVHIELDVPAQSYPEIPSDALVVRRGATLVPVLARDSTVHFRPVTVATNNGSRVRILSGLAAGEEVILNAGDALTEGARVRPTRDSTTAGARR